MGKVSIPIRRIPIKNLFPLGIFFNFFEFFFHKRDFWLFFIFSNKKFLSNFGQKNISIKRLKIYFFLQLFTNQIQKYIYGYIWCRTCQTYSTSKMVAQSAFGTYSRALKKRVSFREGIWQKKIPQKPTVNLLPYTIVLIILIDK